VEARLLNTAQGANSSSSENVRTLLGFFCKIFSFAKFPFGLKPELHIPSHRFVVFFPDFSSLGLARARASLFQFFHQGLDTLHGFPIANLPREITVLVGLLYEAGDEMLLIHRAPL
jgi:hypothetical protein